MHFTDWQQIHGGTVLTALLNLILISCYYECYSIKVAKCFFIWLYWSFSMMNCMCDCESPVEACP